MDSGILKETIMNLPMSSSALEVFHSAVPKDFESYIVLDQNGQIQHLFTTMNNDLAITEMPLTDVLSTLEPSDCSMQSNDDNYLPAQPNSISTENSLIVNKSECVSDHSDNEYSSSLLCSSNDSSLLIDSSLTSTVTLNTISQTNPSLLVETNSSSLNTNDTNALSKLTFTKNEEPVEELLKKSLTGTNGFNEENICNSSKVTFQAPKKVSVSNKSNKVVPLNNIYHKKVKKVNKKVNPIEHATVKRPMAIVSISTHKAKDTTEIKIQTDKGEEFFKGKTSDLMEATQKKCKELAPQMQLSKVNLSKALSDSGDEAVEEALKKVGVTDETFSQLEMESGNSKFWFCPQDNCFFTSAKLIWLKIHLLHHYGVRPYKCDYENCDWSFYSLFKLKRHKETHLKKKSYKCDLCGRFFTTVYNLHTHLKLHERPADIVCPVENCNSAFQTKRCLELHLKVHKEVPAPYHCERKGCGKSYYSINALRSHSRFHTYSEEDLKCNFCMKVFDKPCRLKAHIRMHTGVKPYRCKFEGCSWAFTTSSKLTRHMCKHTNVRKYPCSIDNCGKSYLRSEHLKDHMLTHFTAKSFLCPVENCTYAFSARSSLYVHVKKAHNKADELESDKVVSENQVAQPCIIKDCCYKYSSRNDLRQHLLGEHLNVSLQNENESTMSSEQPSKTQWVDIDAIGTMDPLDLIGNDENFSSLNALNCSSDESSISGINLNLGPEGLLVSLPDLVSSNSDFATLLMPDKTPEIHSKQSVSNVGSSQPKVKISPSHSEVSSKKSIEHLADSSSNSGIAAFSSPGCARTNLTLKDIRDKYNKKEMKVSKKQESNNLKMIDSSSKTMLISQSDLAIQPGLKTSDIVLSSSWLDDNLSSLMLQDDLSNGAELYETAEDESSLIESSANEYQVFLLDSNASMRHCEFEPSTINLRDLE